MKASVANRINHIRNNGYELSFNDIFEKTSEIFKKTVWLGGLAILVGYVANYIVSFILQMIFLGGAGAINSFDPTDSITDISDIYAGFFGVGMVLYLLVSLVVSALYYVLIYGVLNLSRKYETTGEVDFAATFGFFKQPYITRIFLIQIIISVIMVLILGILIGGGFGLTYGISGTLDDSALLVIIPLYLLALVLILFLSVCFFLAVPFAVFAEASPMEAIKASFEVCRKKFWVILGLIIAIGFLSTLGLLACVIGVFFSMVFFWTLPYVLYREIIGFEEESEIEKIGQTTNEF